MRVPQTAPPPACRILIVTFRGMGSITAHIRGGIFAGSFAEIGWTVRFMDVEEHSDSDLVAAASDCDLVYLLKIPYLGLIRQMRESSSARFVFDLTDALWQPHHRWNKWEDLEKILAEVDAIFSDNDFVAAYGRRYNDHVHVIPACTQVERFDALRATHTSREDDDSIVIGWVGTFSTISALDVVADSLDRLSLRHPMLSLRLLILGLPQNHPLPFQRARCSVVAQYDEDLMIRELLAMDIGLFPPPFDLDDYAIRGPLKALLYMTAGVPPVCADAGVCATAITDGVNGMLVGGTSSWEEKIEALLLSPPLRRRMAESALANVRQRHSLRKIFAETVDAMTAVLALPQPRCTDAGPAAPTRPVAEAQQARLQDGAPPKRVMIGCSHFWPSVGGVETRVEQLSAGLAAAGYDVTVITPAYPGRAADTRHGVRILSVPPGMMIDGVPGWPGIIPRALSSGYYDAAILIQDPQGVIIWSVERVARPPATRLVVQPIINMNGYGKWKDNEDFRNRLGAILRNATAAVAMTQTGAEREFMLQSRVTPAYIPNATAVPPPSGGFRQRHGIAKSSFLVLHVANLYWVKNHLGLIETLSGLPDGCRLAMIGNPSGEADCAQEVMASLSRHPGILFLQGFGREEVSTAMAEADVIVLASHGEGSPNTILEAMAQGKPWLATPECGAANDNAGGIVCPLDDFPAYLAVLREFPALGRELGALGHRHWESCLSWPIVIEGWIDLIERGELRHSFDMPVPIAQSMAEIRSVINDRKSELMRSGPSAGALDAESGFASDGGTAAKVAVSVIIPTYNRPGMLQEALQSVLQQKFQDFEIVVVNDGGEDVSALIKELRSPRISYFSHETNMGMAAARNTALRAAAGEFITYLDDDDIYYPDHLETLVTFLRGGGENVAYTDAHRAHQRRDRNGRYQVTGRDTPYSCDFDYRQILVSNFIPILCVMHRAQCLREVLPFDEKLRAHEDWDLWIRLSRKYSFHHISRVTCEFRWREDGSSTTSSHELDFIETQQTIYRKYHGICSQFPKVVEQQKISLLLRKKRAEKMAPITRSIIIPVFNQLPYTARCLEILYDVTPLTDCFEVIVVDNASTDGTRDFLQQAEKAYPNLRVVSNAGNLLFARACNQGAEIAQSELLVFLNNDTEPEPGWLERLVAPLQYQDVGMVGAKLLFPDRTVQHGGMVFVSCGDGADSVFSIHRCRGAAEDDPRINRPEEVQAVTGACVAITRDLFMSVGGFCEEYGMYYEDVDLCLKVAKRGKKVFYQPEAVLLHHENKSTPSSEVARALDAKARAVFLKKWGAELPGLAQLRLSTGPERILWVRPDSIGDGVLAAAMLPHLKAQHPSARITALCQTHVAELYEASPFVDAIIAFDRRKGYQDEAYRKLILQKLRAERADVALYSVFSRDPLYDFFTIGSGATERIAFHGNLCNIDAMVRDENNPLFTKVIRSQGEWKPELERHRDFLKGIGIDASSLEPTVWMTGDDEAFADRFFEENGLEAGSCIGLFAGAQSGQRRYTHYGKALAAVCKEGGYSVLAFGTAEEFGINQQNLEECGARAINTSGALSLRQTAAIVKRCRAVVGAETGTAHIACAVKTPNVILLGGGHFSRFMPYSPLTAVACLPLSCYCCNWRCSHQRVHCVKDLHPEVIREALRQTLEGPSEKIRLFCQSNDSWFPMAGEPPWKRIDNALVHYPLEIFYVGNARTVRGEEAFPPVSADDLGTFAGA